MELSQQRHWLWLYSFIIPCLQLCGISYALCLLSSPNSGVWRCSLQLCLCPCYLLNAPQLVQGFGLLQPLFYLGYFCIALWDILSGLCILWDSLSSFQSLWLGNCILGWSVWPVIGYPLLGVHPSICIVRLIVIGYCCNHFDGQLNYQASAHWLISVTMMNWLCDQ